jgi:hypothetical protein
MVKIIALDGATDHISIRMGVKKDVSSVRFCWIFASKCLLKDSTLKKSIVLILLNEEDRVTAQEYVEDILLFSSSHKNI